MNVPPVCTESRAAPINPAKPQPTRTAPGTAVAPGPHSGPFALSPTSTASRTLAAAPPVDTAKVAALRERISVGTYPIDPQAIAAKMIALDLPRG